MGHQYLIEKIFDTTIKVQTATPTSWYTVAGCDRVGFFITIAETAGSPGDLTLTLEGTLDDSTAVTLSFQDGGGCGDSEVYAAAAEDHIWLPPGSPAPSKIRVSMISAATTDASNYWTIEIWLVADRT